MEKIDYIEIITKNIKKMCDIKNISPHMLGKESGVGKDIITNMNKGSLPSCDKLAKIADYLEISVDYLLGRTDKPNGYSNNDNSFIVGNNSTQTVGNYNNISTNKSNDISDDAREIDNILKSLSFRERVRFLNKIYDLEEEFKKKEA